MAYLIVQAVAYPLIPMDAVTYEKLNATRVVRPCKSDKDLIWECRDADAVIVTGMTIVNKEVISHLDRCRIIAVSGAGHQVDINAATDKGIGVVNVPDYCVDEVSDHAMGLLISCTRKIQQLATAVSQGHWNSVARPKIRNDIWPGMSKLRDSTLGLVGFGRVARAMVSKAQGFGMKVIVYSPRVSEDVAKEFNITLCDLNDLVRTSDYVSLHCPLVEENRHLFNAGLLAKMKPTAFIINTARGPLIDEIALYQAIVNGSLAGAGLDVLEEEDPPYPDNPLYNLPQVIITAHSAHYSDTAMAILKQRPDEEVCSFLNGMWPRNLVNPEVRGIYEKKWGRIV